MDEMTDDRTAHSTLAYLLVRDQAHANAYANALGTLCVDRGKTPPIPKTNAEQVAELMELRLQPGQYSFGLDNLSEAGRILQGVATTIATERMEEFSPGLDTDLLALQATAEPATAEVQVDDGPVTDKGASPAPGNDGTASSTR